MLPVELPSDMPSFLRRFGSDEQCREHLFSMRWPGGFSCTECGQAQCYAHRRRLIYECSACGQQHSLLAGTIFEQTKTGLAKWYLAIFLITTSKRGIAAAELKRQLGFGSDETAWTWLHKIRSAMGRALDAPLQGNIEAEEVSIGAARAERPGTGAAIVAGAVEKRIVVAQPRSPGRPLRGVAAEKRDAMQPRCVLQPARSIHQHTKRHRVRMADPPGGCRRA